MSDVTQMLKRLEHASGLAPAGYALAFHIRYTTPTFLLQAYPKAWTTYYSLHALVMADPTVSWGFSNDGSCRWSDLTDDPSRVMQRAAQHGLNYGIVCALETDGSRSFGSFARADREFTQDEIDELSEVLSELHDATKSVEDLSPEAIEALRGMSINYAKG
ncbi:MAG: LuxR family transcriptional regulator [Loktanella salsilacus]|jgi:LuxR family transcriptional regulator|uniref:LuxR family transcriptional regulator n=1 Tax=Loktanella salsilacus TaxID=195913 RepID=A0A1I4ECC3_9RHOB|nr:autoinducer binding domain-containing protein [Loktanella salsilacus]SFL02016.1 LuxR family transcriptional regulator [Loktanella salsilacus]|tara:strand:+ start:814 stop:1296 length:483 start_codon:yes stop_codon:yes gene_type:complete